MDYNFTFQEKKEALAKKGYRIEQHTIKRWNQWGNHDSQGDWEDFTTYFALNGDRKPSLDNTVEEVFKWFFLNAIEEEKRKFLESHR